MDRRGDSLFSYLSTTAWSSAPPRRRQLYVASLGQRLNSGNSSAPRRGSMTRVRDARLAVLGLHVRRLYVAQGGSTRLPSISSSTRVEVVRLHRSAARCWLHGQLLGWLQDQRAQGSSTISRLPHVFWLHRLERHSFTLEQQLHGSVKNAATGLLGGSSPWLCGGSCWRGCGSRQRAVVAFYVPAFSSLCSHCFCFFARQTLTLPFASASSSWTSLSSTTCPLSS